MGVVLKLELKSGLGTWTKTGAEGGLGAKNEAEVSAGAKTGAEANLGLGLDSGAG